jgi:DNA-binding LytR/AlgR family response regulator
MKLRCLLVDDEPPALKILASYIAGINGLEIVGQCNNAIEALDVLHHKSVDVIFLDIKMPKMLGIDFLRNLSNSPKVIFVTAYRDYAVEGYELDAVDYLVKPVSFERFIKAISKLNWVLGRDLPAPASFPDDKQESFIYLRVDKEMKKIFVNEIQYVESLKDYVRIYLGNSRSLLVKQSIRAMENLLSEHKFLRVHRSYIVSTDKISSFNRLTVKVGTMDIPIGRLYKQTVMDRLNAS